MWLFSCCAYVFPLALIIIHGFLYVLIFKLLTDELLQKYRKGRSSSQKRIFVVSGVQLQHVPPTWLFFTREPVKSNGSIGRVDYEVKGDSLIGSVKSCLALQSRGIKGIFQPHTHTHPQEWWIFLGTYALYRLNQERGIL
jgi:hypothetical protein